MELNRWGSGDYCESGNKVYCCEVPGAKDTGCYWTGTGGQCNSGDELMVSIAKLVLLTKTNLF
jgi:chitinase